MHADVAGHAFEFLGELDEGFDFVVVFYALGELRLGSDGVFFFVFGREVFGRVLDGDGFAWLVGDEFADAVAEVVAQVKHAAYVAYGGAGCHGAKGGNLADGVFAVFVFDVINHAVAVGLAKVDVKVGHGYPLGVEETLKQQLVGQWVEVGDFERIGNERACA